MNKDTYDELTKALLEAAGFGEDVVLDFHSYPDRLVATVLADTYDENAYAFDEHPELTVRDVTVEVGR